MSKHQRIEAAMHDRRRTTKAQEHAQALRRGGVFALCVVLTLSLLWGWSTIRLPVDMRGIGQAALAQVQAIASAPAQAQTSFFTPQTSDRSVTGALQ